MSSKLILKLLHCLKDNKMYLSHYYIDLDITIFYIEGDNYYII